MSNKRQNGGRNSPKALRVPFPLNGADFCGEGTGHFRSSSEKIWNSIWKDAKSLRGVIGPISTPNDYLTTVLNDACQLQKHFPPTVPMAKALTCCNSLPSGAPNENIVQNHLNIALLNVF